MDLSTSGPVSGPKVFRSGLSYPWMSLCTKLESPVCPSLGLQCIGKQAPKRVRDIELLFFLSSRHRQGFILGRLNWRSYQNNVHLKTNQNSSRTQVCHYSDNPILITSATSFEPHIILTCIKLLKDQTAIVYVPIIRYLEYMQQLYVTVLPGSLGKWGGLSWFLNCLSHVAFFPRFFKLPLSFQPS